MKRCSWLNFQAYREIIEINSETGEMKGKYEIPYGYTLGFSYSSEPTPIAKEGEKEKVYALNIAANEPLKNINSIIQKAIILSENVDVSEFIHLNAQLAFSLIQGIFSIASNNSSFSSLSSFSCEVNNKSIC